LSMNWASVDRHRRWMALIWSVTTWANLHKSSA
jgi:hypothetical protein